MILGMSLKTFAMYFDSRTCTKPTGATTIPVGWALPRRMRSQSSMMAVGALPTAKSALGCSSTARRIPCLRARDTLQVGKLLRARIVEVALDLQAKTLQHALADTRATMVTSVMMVSNFPSSIA